ncbi:ATP-binding protein [Actinomadura sp. NAK00032]|uniref:ATP-binding protein n=1 Tax=Actinomadura sp. NAK00032 TaxID=2742128 RepID=UPI001591CF0E|nr:ATP-binding protein [Actinomadura sp. NAK00032]QKW38034.1 ATP-binding protein [Actinomadura sp. NAK00032]
MMTHNSRTSGTEPARSGSAFPAWPLPPDPTAAAQARAIAGRLAAELGLSASVTDDVRTIISELAANAVLHGDRWSAELWARIGRRNRPHVTFTVFDAGPWRGPAALPAGPVEPSDACRGRGLALVSALTAEIGGRWGVHPGRAKLGGYAAPGRDPVSGKAVYVAVPLPLRFLILQESGAPSRGLR